MHVKPHGNEAVATKLRHETIEHEDEAEGMISSKEVCKQRAPSAPCTKSANPVQRIAYNFTPDTDTYFTTIIYDLNEIRGRIALGK